MAFRVLNVDDLTKIQHQIIKEPLRKSFAVVGGPGTGKTVIALERLKQVLKNGVSACYIAYNRNLVQYADYMIKETMNTAESGIVRTLYSWLGKVYYDATGDYIRYDFNNYDWDEIGTKIDEALENKIIDKIPIIIVDEIQDFPPEALTIINKMGDTINIFVDDNQKIDIDNIYDIFTAQGTALSVFNLEENFFDLTENFRNTREIERVAKIFMCEGDGIFNDITCARISARRRGDKPALIYSDSFAMTCHSIRQYAEHNSARTIGVIIMSTKSSIFDQYLKEFVNKSNYHFQYTFGFKRDAQFDYSQSGIYMMTYKTCKGLEFDDVFILEADAIENSFDNVGLRRQIYVVCTRARESLSFVYHDPAASVISRLNYPENLKLFTANQWSTQKKAVLSDILLEES